jgi:hypothetical protein
MDWNTIAVELLERVLLFTKSPEAIALAHRVCKNWNAIGQDPHLWKYLYNILSTATHTKDELIEDWRKKVVDLFLIRKNVKNGRCVMRTLAATYGITKNTAYGTDNHTFYKDYFLANWLTLENFGSYGQVNRIDSDLINMVTEDVINLKKQNFLFINIYVADSTSSYYGGASFDRVKAHKFDVTEMHDFYFDDRSVVFQMPEKLRYLVKNYCSDSKYVAFWDSSWDGPTILFVVDAESGAIIWSLGNGEMYGNPTTVMYDMHLAVKKNSTLLEVIDVTTNARTKKMFVREFTLGFMTANSIVLRTENQVILWNYKNNTEVMCPAGEIPMEDILMIYQDMWVVNRENKLEFFDVQDGSLISTLAARHTHSSNLSLLSDGRLAITSRYGCAVFSFLDSEVNRKIKVDVMDIDGKITSHEISAYSLPELFASQTGREYSKMVSRVVSYAAPCQSDERFVMIFAQQEKPDATINKAATELLGTAKLPIHLNQPYEAWIFNGKAVMNVCDAVRFVYSTAIIVREKKIDGRWQLVSI